MIILKDTKNQGFTLSLEYTFFEKQKRGQIDPPLSCFNVKENRIFILFIYLCHIIHQRLEIK